MTAPPVAVATSAEPLSISVPDFQSIRECINWLVDWAQARGSQVGYRQMSRLYHREKLAEAERIDYALGLHNLDRGEGHLGQDRSFGTDPTGETAVKNVMRELLMKEDAA